MPKLIASVNITLDGFMASLGGNLDWHLPYWDDELCDSFCRLLSESDTILLGANTYRAFAGYWPNQSNDASTSRGDIVLSEIMNRHNKVLVSTTIANPKWQNTKLLKGDLKVAIQNLKMQSGEDIIILGSRRLLTSLIKMSLVDRYELWIHPVNIGKGERLFSAKNFTSKLTETGRQVFHSGVVRLSYETKIAKVLPFTFAVDI